MYVCHSIKYVSCQPCNQSGSVRLDMTGLGMRILRGIGKVTPVPDEDARLTTDKNAYTGSAKSSKPILYVAGLWSTTWGSHFPYTQSSQSGSIEMASPHSTVSRFKWIQATTDMSTLQLTSLERVFIWQSTRPHKHNQVLWWSSAINSTEQPVVFVIFLSLIHPLTAQCYHIELLCCIQQQWNRP